MALRGPQLAGLGPVPRHRSRDRGPLGALEEEAQDSEIRAAIFWSLSKIGGEEVRETLETILEETEDEEEVEILEEALDNLSFTEDVGLYGGASLGTYTHADYHDGLGDLSIPSQTTHWTVEAGLRFTLFP